MVLRQMREQRRSNALGGEFTDSSTGVEVKFEERTGNQEKKVALYNLVQRQWGPKMDMSQAVRLAKQTVFACTAHGCTWTSSRPNQHGNHASSTDAQRQQHKRAESSTVDNYFQCSACGSKNPRPLRIEKHIEGYRMLSDHTEASEYVTRIFSLEEPPDRDEDVLDHEPQRPVAVRSERKRSRGRKRSRNRSKR